MWCSGTAGPGKATPPPASTPLARGVGWLLSETGVPRRIKAAWLSDDDIADLAKFAADLRHQSEAA